MTNSELDVLRNMAEVILLLAVIDDEGESVLGEVVVVEIEFHFYAASVNDRLIVEVVAWVQ